MSNKEEPRSLFTPLLIMLVATLMLYLTVRELSKPPVTNKKGVNIDKVKLKLANQVLGSIEEYYIVKANDPSIIRRIKLRNINVDTLNIIYHE